MIFSHRSVLAFFFCAAALAPLAAFAKTKKAAAAESGATYKGYIVIDAATGKTLAEDHADEVSPPASMAKLMTFAVLHDKLAAGTITLATLVRITPEDAHMGGTQVYLDPKETYPVEELIYAMMIQSANDAAHALARTVAGSPEAFVGLMNAKARELGMTRTTFRTPHGLPPSSRHVVEGDLTTPRDFALLCRHLVQKTDVLKYTAVRTRKFGEGVRPPDKVIAMINHDHLLNRVSGVDGLKTGYTEGAGYCLSSTAQRNGHRLIVVIMGAFGPNGQKDKGHSRDLKTIELLERGFAAVPPDAPAFAPAPGAVAAPAASPISAAPLSDDDKKSADTDDDSGSPAIKFPIPAKK